MTASARARVGQAMPVHQPTSVLQLLEDAVPAVGAGGRRVVRVLRPGYPESMLGDVRQLMNRANVAPQVLDSLAAAAGFRDFAEAQHVVRSETDRALRTPGARYTARLAGRAHRRPGPAERIERIAEQDGANIAATLRTLAGNGSLELAASAIVAARRRYVVADRKSYAYAYLLGHDLQAFLREVLVVDGLVNRPLDVLADLSPADIAICFSLRRYARSVLLTARHLAQAGATVIGVTDDSASELATIASIPLVVETTSQSLFDSPAAVASTLHALVTLVALRARGARFRLARRDELAQKLAVYADAQQLGDPGE